MLTRNQAIRRLILSTCFAFALSVPSAAHADFFQGFEGDNTVGWFGPITPEGTLTNGIASADGAFHGIVEQGAFTRFGGYSSTWPGSFTASVDIFLENDWDNGEGFQYTVAASRQNGDHLRDFIFHVTQDDDAGGIVVAADNNATSAPRLDLDTASGFNTYSVLSGGGWYTFEQVFYDVGGILNVNLNVYDDMGDQVFTDTRSNPTDLIASVVGGNRYGWFPTLNIAGGIAIDNSSLEVVPEPSTYAGLLGIASISLLAYGWRRKQQQAV